MQMEKEKHQKHTDLYTNVTMLYSNLISKGLTRKIPTPQDSGIKMQELPFRETIVDSFTLYVIFCFNYYFLGAPSPWNSEEILPPLHAHFSSGCPCMAISPIFHLDSVGSTVCQSAHPAVYQLLLIQLFVRSASQLALAFSYLHFNYFAFSTSAFSSHIFLTYTFTT